MKERPDAHMSKMGEKQECQGGWTHCTCVRELCGRQVHAKERNARKRLPVASDRMLGFIMSQGGYVCITASMKGRQERGGGWERIPSNKPRGRTPILSGGVDFPTSLQDSTSCLVGYKPHSPLSLVQTLRSCWTESLAKEKRPDQTEQESASQSIRLVSPYL